MHLTKVMYSHSSAVKDEMAKKNSMHAISIFAYAPLIACKLGVERTDYGFSYV